jgi:putative ABC transport system ATP-binding protein
MNLLGLLDMPSEGHYWLGGRDTAQLRPDERAVIRNRKIGFVFQGANLLPRSTALENVELPLVYSGVTAEERRRRTTKALHNVGLAHREQHWPQELSGGEQQRVAVARAIVNRPILILADEPTGALDSRTGAEVLLLFQRLHEHGATIVLVTHDPLVARRARRVIELRDGQVVGDRPTQQRGADARAVATSPRQAITPAPPPS